VKGAGLVSIALTASIALGGCGLNVTSPDLFLITRTGQGSARIVLVNDSGTISCDGRAARQLPDPTLIQARALASDLDRDAKAKLRIPARAGSVYQFRIKLPDGTISFPDTSAAGHPELAQAELFTVQALSGLCGGG
jgi:hypothetical protein